MKIIDSNIIKHIFMRKIFPKRDNIIYEVIDHSISIKFILFYCKVGKYSFLIDNDNFLTFKSGFNKSYIQIIGIRNE